MGRGGQKVVASGEEVFTWDEVKKHQSREDKWIVIDGEVLDITRWASKHPGGSRVISHYAGQDASEAFRAFHNDVDNIKKYMRAIKRGTLQENTTQQDHDTDIKHDFEQLRQTAEKLGLFRPSVAFFLLSLGHIILLEVLSYVNLWYFGTGWLPFVLSILMFATVQAQAGWTQHDFGHLSVFHNSTLDHLAHQFVIGFTKGAASDWWNHLHYQHHAKPNVMDKDPDVRLEALFVVGEEMPKKVAKNKNYKMPYNHQHKYFSALLPPLLFPLYFQVMLFRHTITRRKWVDLVWTSAFYVKFFLLYSPLLGFGWAFVLYFFARVVESIWFTWVSQSNHIPMEIASDKERPWLPLQLSATCDVEQSFFNDWFTGHLNFQIEHHLFPRMPRHNLYKVAPLVKSLCQKHNIPYVVKPLMTAFADILRSLKHSGEIWSTYVKAHDMDH